LTSSLMAAALLAHALLGCCWHHAHACVTNRAEQITECSGHEAEHSHPGDSSRHDSHQHQCAASACVFLRAEGQPISALPAAWAVDLVCPVQNTQPTPESGCSTYLVDSGQVPTPLRLHLLLQILLI
jgi:hypothetical protein